MQVQRKNKEKQERNTKELKKVNDALKQFLHIVSHDLRSPINHIVSFSNLLKTKDSKNLDQESIDFLNIIGHSAQKMDKLVRTLLDYVDIGSNIHIEESINTNQVVWTSISKFEQQIKEHNIDVVVGNLPIIKANFTIILRLFSELLDNALKFSKKGTDAFNVIEISATEQEAHYLFSVRDEGIGIVKAQQGKVFDLLKRLHTDEEYQGLGIGLAICQKIIHLYEGEIWVDSELGHGTTFYFSLPKQR